MGNLFKRKRQEQGKPHSQTSPEYPAFNLVIKPESIITQREMLDPAFVSNWARTVNLLGEHYVTSEGRLVRGRAEGVGTLEADLEITARGNPSELHINHLPFYFLESEGHTYLATQSNFRYKKDAIKPNSILTRVA